MKFSKEEARMDGWGCWNCFFWEPDEPEKSLLAACLCAGEETSRGYYCDFWQERGRVDPETGQPLGRDHA